MKKKILLLTSSLAEGGAEKVISIITSDLNDEYDIIIVSLSNNTSYGIKSRLIKLNYSLNNKYTLLLYLPKYVITYRKIIDLYKPDISISYLLYPSIINLMANLGRRKTKLMMSLHSVTSKKLENYNLLLIKSLIGLFFNSFDKIHVLSETLKIDLIKNYRVNNGKIVVIANPIEISRINELKKEKISDSWYNPNDAYIINIGRLTKVKGQHNLIKAFSKILLKSDCKLLICGKGELEEDLIQLVKRLNIEDKVFFLGWVNNPYKYLASSKIFVMTSLYEAFPVAMIEAMACDLPVISTKCGFGPDEILGDGKYGILTPSMDTNQITIPDLHSLSEQIFVDEVLNILTDDDKRKDWVKRSQIRAKFYDVKNILRKYRNTFDNL